MPDLLLFIPDAALREAVVEQIKVAKIREPQLIDAPQAYMPAGAQDEPPVVLLDGVKALTSWQAAFPPPFSATLLVLGEAQENEAATETFSKPLRLGHLIARVRYYLETAPLLRNKSIPLGAYRLETHKRSLVREDGDEALRLTEKETALLAFLAEQKEPASRRDILASVWGYDERIDTHTLDTHLYHLRRKLGEDWLVFEAGGYRLRGRT